MMTNTMRIIDVVLDDVENPAHATLLLDDGKQPRQHRVTAAWIEQHQVEIGGDFIEKDNGAHEYRPAATRATASMSEADERALFEKNLREKVMRDSSVEHSADEYVILLLQRNANGDYATTWVQSSFEGWQDRAALAHGAARAAVSEQTDERALFDKAFLSWNGFHTKAELDLEWDSHGGLAATMFREGFRAALAQRASSAPAVTEITDAGARQLIDFIYERVGFTDRDVLIGEVQRIVIGCMNASYAAGVRDAKATPASAPLAPAKDSLKSNPFDAQKQVDVANNDAQQPIPAQPGMPATAQPADDQAALDAQLRQEVVAMYQLLDDGEWAEHLAVTPHGQCLETAITRLVGKAASAQPVAAAPAVTDGMVAAYLGAQRAHVAQQDAEPLRLFSSRDACRAGLLAALRAAPAAPVVQADDAGRAAATSAATPASAQAQKPYCVMLHSDGTMTDMTHMLSSASAQPAGTALADLWMHEDMDRDAAAAAMKAPRKDLKAAHKKAVDDLIYWKRRALTAEASAQPVAAAPADTLLFDACALLRPLIQDGEAVGVKEARGLLRRIDAYRSAAATPAAPVAAAPADLTDEQIMRIAGDVRQRNAGAWPGDVAFARAVLSAAPAAPVAQADDASPAARDVLAERRRQVEAEGWTPEHDDMQGDGQMAVAAGYYALACGYPHERDIGHRGIVPTYWPWAPSWWKPSTARRNLVKAGALVLAEIERIDRAAQAEKGGAA